MNEAIYVLESGQELHNVHAPEDCIGRACCIHEPSDHSMRDFPRYWREDRGIMERICPHGIGHPDPDDIAWQVMAFAQEGRDPTGLAVHGCDGCCS